MAKTPISRPDWTETMPAPLAGTAGAEVEAGEDGVAAVVEINEV